MKTKLFHPLLILLTSFSLALNAQESAITVEQLPQNARKFITSYFPKDNITHIIKDKELTSTEYKVYLEDGKKIEFNGSGEWKEVNGKKIQNVSGGYIPASITSYINKTYKNTFITKIEKELFKYEVKISNGLELEFNKKGDFVKIDD